MISRAIAFESAMSLPTFSPSQTSAHWADAVRRGSIDVEPRAVPDPLEQMVEPDRVRFARVRSPEEDDVRLLHFAVGARAPARTEDRRQTDDARSVSGPVAAVDVVGAERRPGRASAPGSSPRCVDFEQLKMPSAFRPVRGEVAAESFRRAVERLVPRRGTEDAVVADERLRQPCIGAGWSSSLEHALIIDDSWRFERQTS